MLFVFAGIGKHPQHKHVPLEWEKRRGETDTIRAAALSLPPGLWCSSERADNEALSQLHSFNWSIDVTGCWNLAITSCETWDKRTSFWSMSNSGRKCDCKLRFSTKTAVWLWFIEEENYFLHTTLCRSFKGIMKKRVSFPPFTDALQLLSFFCFIWFSLQVIVFSRLEHKHFLKLMFFFWQSC